MENHGINYFDSKNAAERYAIGRPDFHAQSIAHIRTYLALRDKVENALDVACGTGLSSVALLPIARNVYATDSSSEMLRLAPMSELIRYSLSGAVNQPFKDDTFELVTICSGIHWLDINRFLIEAARVLKNNHYLVIYDNFFIAEMMGQEQFKDWYNQVYLQVFPPPPRNNSFDWDKVTTYHFLFMGEEEFKNRVQMNQMQLVLYLTTQSNIIAAVEAKKVTYAQVEDWLNDQLGAFFGNPLQDRIIYFGNHIRYLRKRLAEKA